MTGLIYVCRFFLVVSPVPRLMHVTIAATAAAGVAVIMVDAGRAGTALTPVLLLQLFAAASGFMVPARRGHFDLVLSAGESRRRVACVHWLMSTAPGLLAWLALALAEAAVSRGALVLVTSGTLAAVVLVSTIPWAATVALPRFAGAIGWLLMLTVFAMVVNPAPTGFGVLGGGSSIEAFAAVALHPTLLVGQDVTGPAGRLATPLLVGAAAAMVYAFIWIDSHDIPLEAAQ